MFFDQNIIQRGQAILDAHQDHISEGISEDIYAPSLQTEDMWKKFAIPTPPYSPETYNVNTTKTHIFSHHHHPHHQNNLQVVPDDFPEELSSDLPMVLSDAEMERLTSSTLGNDCPWSEAEPVEPPPTSLSAMRQTMVPVENTMIQELPMYQQKQYREFQPFPQAMTIQENCVTQQHSPQNWSPYSGKYLYLISLKTRFQQTSSTITFCHKDRVYLYVSFTTYGLECKLLFISFVKYKHRLFSQSCVILLYVV